MESLALGIWANRLTHVSVYLNDKRPSVNVENKWLT